MNKRRARHLWKQFHAIHGSYFLMAALLCGVISLSALRGNNQHMSKLRDDVYNADKNDGDVQVALINLQRYVTAHMNTDLKTGNGSVYPPIQLQYTYQRLVDQRASKLESTNGNLYTEAQAYCQAQNSTDFSGRNRVPCIEQYVSDHGAKLPDISPSLYQFDFVAPKWSPDLAGWSLLATFLLLIVGVAKLAFDIYVKRRAR